jgi:hypothetical protein
MTPKASHTKDPRATEASHTAGEIRLNVFRGAREKTPIAQDDYTWPELVEVLGEMVSDEADAGDPRKQKLSLLAVTFGPMREAYNVDANVEHLDALAIDVDTCDGDALVERLATLKISAFVYASPSDPNPDGSRRVRVIAPLDAPLLPAGVKHARHAFAEMLGLEPGQGVENADAVSQVMFVGKLYGTPDRDVCTIEGEPLNTATLATAQLVHAWPTRARKAKAQAAPADTRFDAEPDERTAALLTALEPHWEAPGEATGRRGVLRALGGYLARRGWPDDQIVAVGRGLETERPESVRVATMIECAREARTSTSSAGWSALVNWNATAAAAIENAAKDPREPADWPGVWSEWWASYLERRAARNTNSKESESKPADEDPFAPATDAPEPQTPEDDWDAPEQPIEWYCEGLAIAPSERKVTLIAGDPGSGKGPLANYLAVCFALGLKAFGEYPCKQCNVGILDLEGARLTKRRIRSQARGLKRDPAELKGRLFVRDVSSGDMANIAWLPGWIASHGIEVLIVDSYTSASSGLNIDPNSQEFANLAHQLAPLLPVTIAVAHARKPAQGKRGERPSLGDVAGSYALGSMAATAIAVWKPDDERPELARVGCMRAPDEPFHTIDVTWTKDTNAPADAPVWRASMAGAVGKQARKEASEASADERLTTVAGLVIDHMWASRSYPMSVNAVCVATGKHKRDVGKILSALARADMASHRPDPRGKDGGTYQLRGDIKPRFTMCGDTAVPDEGDFTGKFRKPAKRSA